MPCTHCGSNRGTERTVRFEGTRSLVLQLCPECIRDFESDDSVDSIDHVRAV